MKNHEILFSNILTIENKDNFYNFYMKDGTMIEQNIKNATKFVDPSCASIFNMLFLDSTKILNENGQTRLLHLLNSLIFLKDDEKIIKIERLSNEKDCNLIQNLYNILKFDISYKATLSSENKFIIIVIEMLLGNDQSISERLIDKGSSLFSKYLKFVVVLAFINNQENSDIYNSSWIYWNKQYNNGKNVKCDLYEIIKINLKEELNKIKKRNNVYVRKMKLGIDGINWIKLLGIRNWETPYNKYYYLPKDIKFSSNQITSAFEFLKNFDDFSYLK